MTDKITFSVEDGIVRVVGPWPQLAKIDDGVEADYIRRNGWWVNITVANGTASYLRGFDGNYRLIESTRDPE